MVWRRRKDPGFRLSSLLVIGRQQIYYSGSNAIDGIPYLMARNVRSGDVVYKICLGSTPLNADGRFQLVYANGDIQYFTPPSPLLGTSRLSVFLVVNDANILICFKLIRLLGPCVHVPNGYNSFVIQTGSAVFGYWMQGAYWRDIVCLAQTFSLGSRGSFFLNSVGIIFYSGVATLSSIAIHFFYSRRAISVHQSSGTCVVHELLRSRNLWHYAAAGYFLRSHAPELTVNECYVLSPGSEVNFSPRGRTRRKFNSNSGNYQVEYAYSVDDSRAFVVARNSHQLFHLGFNPQHRPQDAAHRLSASSHDSD